jgi:hypothetical protein
VLATAGALVLALGIQVAGAQDEPLRGLIGTWQGQVDVRRLRELREPLARVRATTEDSAALAASYRRRHPPVTPPGVSGDAGGVPPDPG